MQVASPAAVEFGGATPTPDEIPGNRQLVRVLPLPGAQMAPHLDNRRPTAQDSVVSDLT
jgi:hypothetical protein